MTVTLPKLFKHQKDLIDYWLEHPNDQIITTCSPRQCAKSMTICCLLIAASLKESGSISIAVSPIFAQARKQFDDVVNIATDRLIKSKNSSLLEITFINGSKVQFLSAESGDHLRGKTVKKTGVLTIDEAVWITKELFFDVLQPMVNVHRCDIFVFSTPRTKSGLFWELYTKGREEVYGYKTFNWKEDGYDLSFFLPPEKLEQYRQQLPRITFLCEYLAQFVDGNGTVFYDFRKCIKDNESDISKPIIIGCDWGSGAGKDYTVLTFGQFINNKIKIIKQIAFNDKSPTDTIRFIRSEVENLVKSGFKEVNIITEKNSIGAIYHSNLVEAIDEFEQQYNDSVSWRDEIEINCGTFTTTNTSKKKAVEQLIMLFEQDKIEIPDDRELISQLSLFEAKVNKDTGTIQYAVFAPGMNDDRVMSLLFTIFELQKQL